jgi:hypothetical protein
VGDGSTVAGVGAAAEEIVQAWLETSGADALDLNSEARAEQKEDENGVYPEGQQADVTRDDNNVTSRRAGDLSWRLAVVCNRTNGDPRLRRNPTRRMRQDGTTLRLAEEVELKLELRDLPDVAPPPNRDAPQASLRPPEDLVRRVEEAHLTFEDIMGSSSSNEWRALEKRATADDQYGANSSHRRQAPFAKEKGELRVPLSAHPTLVQEVLEAGHCLAFDGLHYRVFDPAREQVKHGFSGDKIKSDAEELGITDDKRTLALLSSNTLFGGARDGAGSTPTVSTFSANQRSLATELPGFKAAFADEIARSCYGDPELAGAESPVLIPAKMSALNLRLKANGTVRIIGNKSCPPKDSFQSIVTNDGSFVDSGPGRRLAANAHVVKFRDRIYLQIEDISQAAATIFSIAQKCGLESQVCGRIFDFAHWFRMIATTPAERWRSQYHLDGAYYGDERSVMGDVAAFDNGQGVTSVVVRVIYKRLEVEVEAYIRKQEAAKWRALTALVDERRALGLLRPLPWFFDGFQDDCTSVTIGSIGDLLDRRIPELFQEYGIKLSSKPAATKPHGPQWDSIGARYEVTKRGLVVRPRPEVQAKFESEAHDFLTKTSTTEEAIESFAGLTEFVRRFADRLPAGSLYRLKAAARRRGMPLRLQDGPARQHIAALCEAIQNDIAPPIDDPAYYAPPPQGCHGDASGKWGFGAVVNGVCCSGKWTDGLFAKLGKSETDTEADQVSISPLELVTAGLVVWLAGVANAPKRILVYGDNESAIVVGARSRAHSGPMGVALDAVRYFERQAGRRAWLVHVPGVDNVVADALSRNDKEAAFDELRRLGYTPRAVDAPVEFYNWLDRLSASGTGPG